MCYTVYAVFEQFFGSVHSMHFQAVILRLESSVFIIISG